MVYAGKQVYLSHALALQYEGTVQCRHWIAMDFQ